MSDSKNPSIPLVPRPEQAGKEITRRDFLNEITLGALGIAGLGSVAVTYQYFSPNVLFEPSTTFRAGRSARSSSAKNSRVSSTAASFSGSSSS